MLRKKLRLKANELGTMGVATTVLPSITVSTVEDKGRARRKKIRALQKASRKANRRQA